MALALLSLAACGNNAGEGVGPDASPDEADATPLMRCPLGDPGSAPEIEITEVLAADGTRVEVTPMAEVPLQEFPQGACE